jgi:hypothetical protein
MMDLEPNRPPHPPAINYILSFILVGLAWGLTTPFIRRAARDHPGPSPAHAALLESESVQQSWWKRRVYGAVIAVVALLRNPRYAVPLVLNLTGSVWFFLLIGKAGTFFFFVLFLATSLPCDLESRLLSSFLLGTWVLSWFALPAVLPCLHLYQTTRVVRMVLVGWWGFHG